MSVNSDIRDGIIQIARLAISKGGTFSAEVTAVDIDTRSCTVLSISDKTETEYTNVWLMPCIDDGILYVPKIGSTVIIENNANLQPFICMWSAIDEILYIINNTVFSMRDGITTFNKGDNDGLVNVKPLTTAISDIQKDINNLKTDLTSLITAVTGSGSTPLTGTSMGGYMSTALSSYNSATLTITEQSDIEDKAVKH